MTIRRIRKPICRLLLLLPLAALLSGCTSLGYYSQAIHGQLSLMFSGEPVAALVADPATEPGLRDQLITASRARVFAGSRLALPVGEAFTDYVELGRPWVVVNLVATPEFSLSPHQWCYPVIGCQAYRGYFDLQTARREQQQFISQGYDTLIGAVTAYSTLGWFDDPLHSGFTSLPEDRMVALMFHELAHRVVYLEQDTAFNESFATAVELEGLRLWLEQQGDSRGFARALARLQQRNRTLALVETAAQALEALYAQQDQLGNRQLRERKSAILDQLASDYRALSRNWPQPGPLGRALASLNNANLALFRQYNQHVPGFRQLLKQHRHDFRSFYDSVSELGERNQAERNRILSELGQRFDEDLGGTPGVVAGHFGPR